MSFPKGMSNMSSDTEKVRRGPLAWLKTKRAIAVLTTLVIAAVILIGEYDQFLVVS
jgi:hypothetical protein